MKKIFTVTTICILTLIFIPLTAQGGAFQDAVTLTGEAANLQTEGRYDASIDKAAEANSAIDQAFMDTLHALLKRRAADAKSRAAMQLNALEKSGADAENDYRTAADNAKKSIAEGDNAVKEAEGERSDEKKAEELYSAAIEHFEKAHDAAKNAHEKYMTQKRALADKALKEALNKYSAAQSKGIIVKNDANDKKIAAAVQAAQNALNANDFKNVDSNVKTILDTIAAAEKGFLAEQGKVKKQLDDAQKQFSQLKNAKIIASGSAEDKDIAKSLSDASGALNSGDFKKAQSAISAAVGKMKAAESAHKTASANTQKQIDAAAARQKKLNADKIMPAGSDTDKQVSDALKLAQTAASNGNFKDAEASVQKAQALMDAAEKMTGTAEAENVQLQNALQTARERYSRIVKEFNIPEDDPASAAIRADLDGTEKALADKDYTQTAMLLSAADKKMDALEKDMAAQASMTENPSATGSPTDTTAQTERLDEDGLPVDELGRVKVLPKYYIVRRRAPITDCLWRIAQADFIYANRDEWRRIYEANKDSFIRRENPHLILPNQVLEIPSLKGEERAGTYNPNKTYVPIK